MERLYRLVTLRVCRLLSSIACKHVSYSVAVALVKGIVHSYPGRRYALANAEPLLRLLNEAKIAHDPMETAIRAAMFKMLFPWAYCRFTRCPEELERWVHVRGLELLTPLLGTGRGILLACNHLGPAHMIEYFMAAQGYQFYAMQRDTCTHHWRMRYAVPGLNTRIKKIFIKQDLSPGLLQTTIKIRDLLHRGEIVMAVLDGSSGKSEIRLSLMGCERAFRIAMPLIASLARAIIVPVYATLQADGHIEIRFEAPLPEQSPDQAPLDYARDIMRKYVARLQSHWETEPGNVKVTMLANRMNYK